MSNNNIKNFKCLDNLIHSGVKEIVLDSDIVLGDDEKYKYLNGIKLDVNDLAIDGNGHVIDARGLTRIFYCTGKNVTIKNMILKNGFSEDGGAINNWGELTITKSTLNNNTAQEYGGAIHNDEGGELTITKTTLNKNTSQEYGGAINNWGELTITKTTLNKNTAQEDSGTIYSNKEISIADCTLVNNLQSPFSFVENNNRFDIAWNDDVISSDEVTIYLDNKCDGKYHIIDNLIEWNKILSKGSHKIILELKDNNKIKMNFTYSPDIIKTNVNNYAELINSINKAKYTITPKYIINLNKRDYNATKTIVWNPISNLNLIINGNGMTLDGQNKCQFIKIGTNSKITLNNIILTKYTTQKYGGAINNWGELTITKSTLKENTAHRDGGAINNNGELTITKSTLNNNTTKYDGGAINNWGELTITESTFNNNTTQEGNGGAIHNQQGEITITKSTLNNNTAHRGGGAITNWSQLTITESTLTENTASNGGAICINNGVCIIMDSSLMNNKTKNDGGGAIYKFSGKLTIADSKINNNMAKRNGGAIANEKDELNIISSILNHNLSNGEYGGGAIISLYEVKINESKFNANVAKEGNGGAIFLKDSKYESKNCTFKDNKPDDVYNDEN